MTDPTHDRPLPGGGWISGPMVAGTPDQVAPVAPDVPVVPVAASERAAIAAILCGPNPPTKDDLATIRAFDAWLRGDRSRWDDEGHDRDQVDPAPVARYLIVNPAGALIEERTAPPLILPDIRRAVGGYVQTISVYAPGVAALVNEDGRALDLPVNLVGTRVLLDLGWSPDWFPTGGIRGPVVLVALDVREREFIGLSSDQVALISDAHRAALVNPSPERTQNHE